MGNCKDGKCFEANVLIALKQILTIMQTPSLPTINRDVELFLVKDESGELWIETKIFNVEDGSFTIEYYRPGQIVPDTPDGNVNYVTGESDLSSIESFLNSILNVLNQIELLSANIDNTLDSLYNILFLNTTPQEPLITVLLSASMNIDITGYKTVSLMFEGEGGEINGIPVSSGYVLELNASGFSTLQGVYSITKPTIADPSFPNSPRVLIVRM